LITCKSGVGALRDNDNKLVVNDKQKADLLNNFFASVGSDDDGNDIALDREVPDNVHQILSHHETTLFLLEEIHTKFY